MNQLTPSISIIIPTHNRCLSLQRTLDALSQQTYSLDKIEVVVVADGCTDDTLKMLQAYQTPFALKVIEQSGQGAGAARNQGAAHAKAALLLFLDDDIEASPQLVDAHVRAHQQRENQVVIGYLPTILEHQTGLFRITLRSWWESMFEKMRQPGHRYNYCDLLSGNFSISAALFHQVGDFDSTFKCHEDYELGVRLIKANAKLTFAADAMGYHHEITDLDRSLRRKYQEGRADVLMGRKYPELKPVLLLYKLAAFCSPVERLLITVLFQWLALADFLANHSKALLYVCEWLRFHGSWRLLLDKLLGYSYLRGVVDESSTQEMLAVFLKRNAPSLDKNELENLSKQELKNRSDHQIEIDLKNGFEAIERQLIDKKPMGVAIYYGKYFVGCIAPQPGAECLQICHIRHTLATTLAWSLLEAMKSDLTWPLLETAKPNDALETVDHVHSRASACLSEPLEEAYVC